MTMFCPVMWADAFEHKKLYGAVQHELVEVSRADSAIPPHRHTARQNPRTTTPNGQCARSQNAKSLCSRKRRTSIDFVQSHFQGNAWKDQHAITKGR
jgi:hypothetical protein